MTGPTSYNPFAGYPARGSGPRFDEARYRRVGASDEELVTLRALFDVLDDDGKRGAASYEASASDDDLREMLDLWREAGSPGPDEVEPTFDVEGSSIPKIEEWVGEDSRRAGYVLQVETERPEDKVRSTLVGKMEAVQKAAAEREETERQAAEQQQGSGDGTGDQGSGDGQQQGGPDTAQPTGDSTTAAADGNAEGEQRPHPSDPTAGPIENPSPDAVDTTGTSTGTGEGTGEADTGTQAGS